MLSGTYCVMYPYEVGPCRHGMPWPYIVVKGDGFQIWLNS
jgi:hypothetical protein